MKKFFKNKNNIGLIFNIIGALLVAFAFGIRPCGGNFAGAIICEVTKKPVEYIYYLHPEFFWPGIILLFLGFFLQLNFKNKK
ncbi:hypothetical protein ACFL1Y_01535 [Patescibacteria group bacterium]